MRAAGDVRGPRSCRGYHPGGRRGRGAELGLRDGGGGAGCGPAEKVSVLPPGLTPSPRCRDRRQGVCRRGGRPGVRPHSLAIRGSGLDHSAPPSPVPPRVIVIPRPLALNRLCARRRPRVSARQGSASRALVAGLRGASHSARDRDRLGGRGAGRMDLGSRDSVNDPLFCRGVGRGGGVMRLRPVVPCSLLTP